MEGREIIKVDENTKGVFVCAKSKYDFGLGMYWLILISDVKEKDFEGNRFLQMWRHASIYYGLSGSIEYASETPFQWGSIGGYIFYKATEEEKKLLKDLIKRKNLKYVKALNRIIKR